MTKNDKIRAKFTDKPLLVVFTTIFIDMLGVGILIPVMPLLVLPGVDRIVPMTWTISQGFILLGWLSASYPLAQFIAAPVLGQLSDRFGRKKVLAISIMGTSLSYSIFAIGIVTKNIPLMFTARIIDGITGGNISVAQAVIADISTLKNRARNFGLVGMAFGLGFILGPYIGGKLADPSIVSWFNASTAFWFAATLSALNVALVLVFLKETISKKTKNLSLHALQAFTNIKRAVTRPGLRDIMPSSFLYNGGFTFFTTFFAIFLSVRFKFNPSNTGDFFAYIGLWIAIVQGGLIGLISKKFKDYQILRFSMFGAAGVLLAFLAVPIGQHGWLFLIPPFLSLFIGMTQAFIPTIVSRVTPAETRGESLGINTSVSALAQAIPAIIAGYVATIDTTATVVVASILMVSAGAVFWILFNPKKISNN